jgi:hypothetical protein
MAVALWLTLSRTFSIAGAERADRGVYGAPPLLALTQRVALLLGRELLGDVGMRGEPAARAHRPADQGDDAPVLEFDSLGFGVIFRRLAQAIGDIAIWIAMEVAGSEPMHQQIAQRRSRPRVLGPQVIHVDVDLVAQHQTRGAVEHAQPLRHVVERSAKQSCLLSPPAVDEQTGDGRGAEAERQADHKGGYRRRRCRQRGHDPGRSAERENGDAERTAANAGHDHKWPVAA